MRKPLPPERVDETIEYEIDDADIDRLQLIPTDQFETFQHIELPDCPVVVTEHRFRIYETPDGSIYIPYGPEVQNQSLFGPQLLSTIGWMKSKAHCSYSMTISMHLMPARGHHGIQKEPPFIAGRKNIFGPNSWYGKAG